VALGFWKEPVKLYQRLKFAHTAAALNGVPSVNLTFLRSANVHDLPALEPFQLVASDGTTVVVPGLSPTRPSKIWMTTRPDSPSEISAPSSATGSADEPNTSVSLAVLCALAPYATATTASATRPKPIMALVSFLIEVPFGGTKDQVCLTSTSKST
jgi:hypothetical protein